MTVWTAERQRDGCWVLLSVQAARYQAEAVCVGDATPYRGFLAPRPTTPRLEWRKTYFAEDADIPDEQSQSCSYADAAGTTYRITEWELP